MEYCPLRNKSTLEIKSYYNVVSLSRCSYLKDIAHLSYQEIKNLDLFSVDYQDFLMKKSSPFCTVNCKSLNSKIKNISLGVSKACNLQCYNCFNRDCHSDNNKTKELYFYLLNKIKGHQLDSLLFNTQGEVFVYYDETIEYLKSLTPNDFKTVIFQTNATLLNDERINDLYRLSTFTGVKYQFYVSMCGCSKAAYEQTQIGANFEQTVKNISSLVTTFGPQNIKITYVIKRTNLVDVLNIKTFFNSLGVTNIDITYDLYDYNCKEVYDELIKTDVGMCIYENFKKEKCAGSNNVKKYKHRKNNKLSLENIDKIYNGSVILMDKLLEKDLLLETLETSEVNIENILNDEPTEEASADEDSDIKELLTVGVTLHGDQVFSQSVIDAFKNKNIQFIVSNDKPTSTFEMLKTKYASSNILFVESKPGIENNRQNILDHTKTKYIYVIDYDDEFTISQEELLNYLKTNSADIVAVDCFEDKKSTADYIYYNSTTLFVVTWAQIFKTTFMKAVGGYLQTWNSYHEEFGTNANMLANIYKNEIHYRISHLPSGIVYYNHILNSNHLHNSKLKINFDDYIKFVKRIPKNKQITYKKEFIEFFKMRLSLMNLEPEQYTLLNKIIKKIEAKI